MRKNIPEDSPIEFYFNTVDSTGAPVAPSSAFAAADFSIHKDGSATEKTSANGITVTSPFDSKTGLHLISIDTSNDTGDSGFWVAGGRYAIRFETAKTVDSISIDGRMVPNAEFVIDAPVSVARVTGGINTAAGTITTLDGLGIEASVVNVLTSYGVATATVLGDVYDLADATYTAIIGLKDFDPATETVNIGKINGSATAAEAMQQLYDAALPVIVDDATFTPTESVFETDGTIAADDTLIGMGGTWYNASGSPANVGLYFITDSEGTTTNVNNKLKLTVETMPVPPNDGDVFIILGGRSK